MQSFLLVCLGSVLLLIGLCSSRITDGLDNVIVVKSDTLPDLINSPSLSLVFFFNLGKLDKNVIFHFINFPLSADL